MKERIKAIRKAVGKTQVDFAAELGVSPSNIISYETGRRSPSDAMINLLCEKYKVNEAWLRTGIGEMLKPVEREAEIAKIAADIYNGDVPEEVLLLQKVVRELSVEEAEVLVGIALKVAEEKEKSLKK